MHAGEEMIPSLKKALAEARGPRSFDDADLTPEERQKAMDDVADYPQLARKNRMLRREDLYNYRPTQEEVDEAIKDHGIWLSSKGRDGLQMDLAGINMQGLDLSGADLQKADLSLALLQNTNFSGSNLRLAGLAFANLEGADLSGANLNKGKFWHTKAKGANFSGADLRYASLAKSGFTGADFTGAKWTGAFLEDSDFTDAQFDQGIAKARVFRGNTTFSLDALSWLQLHPRWDHWQNSVKIVS